MMVKAIITYFMIHLANILGAVEENPLAHDDYFNVKPLVQLKELFDARVHLGHHEGCWNVFMKPYIYGARAHHHIIDLNKTIVHMQV